MADLTPLNLADTLESYLSLLVLYLFNFNSEDIAWLSHLQTFLTNLNFHIANSFSVICLPYLFHSLVYQTLYHFELRGMRKFSSWINGKKEGDEIIQQWTNFNGATKGKSCLKASSWLASSLKASS